MFNAVGYRIKDQSKPHFLTFTVVDWLDIFTRKRYKDIIIDSFEFCQKEKGMLIFGYVIMSNHIHAIIQSSNEDLSGLIRDFKKFTAKQILQSIKNEPESRKEWILERFKISAQKNSRNRAYQFWKYGNHPEEIYSEKFLWTKLDYIHMNPVKAGLVKVASHYLYSSATNYVLNAGLVSVDIVDNPIIDTSNFNSFCKSISW